MKTVLAAATMVALLATSALAERPGSDWAGMDQVVAKLKAAGYGPISKIKADDGHWKAVADKDGKTYKIRLDPKTAEVLKAKPKDDDHDDD